MVPAYFSPAPGGYWDQLATAARQVHLMAILNPNSGPGSAFDANYGAAVDNVRAAGGAVIGYVDTKYAGRTLSDVESDVATYSSWYHLDGIFFDQMTSSSPALSYYQQLYTYVQGLNSNWTVVGNPGTNTTQGYAAGPAADNLVLFESGTGYDTYTPPPWQEDYPAQRFTNLEYDVTSVAMMQADVNLAASRRTGWVYVTDGNLPNPYATLPSYWTWLVAAVAASSIQTPYVVTTTADSGPGSLRDAITQINADTAGNQYLGSHGVDEIDFDITAASDAAGGGTGFSANTGVATITPQSALPPIVNPVFIDGYTQGRGTSFPASPNKLAIGDNAVLNIVVDGSLITTRATGLAIGGGSSTVQGLTIQNFNDEIDLNSSNNVVAGNSLQRANTGPGTLGRGVTMLSESGSVTSNNTIGGITQDARNVISGAFLAGIDIIGDTAAASDNLVEGNYIGTNAAGSAPNGDDGEDGILVRDIASDNTIGGTSSAARNVISGWTIDVFFVDEGPLFHLSGDVLEGNYLGTDASGAVTLPAPQSSTGVFLTGSTNCTIGGTALGSGNLIEGGTFAGVAVVGGNGYAIDGNTITNNGGPGVQVFGGPGVQVSSSTGISIQANSIYGNGQLGIVLGAGGGINTNAGNNQANHQGPNDLMNFPVLTSVQTSAAGTTINGTLDTGTANGVPFLANATITLDFYGNSPAAVDPSGYGQGQIWLGSMTVTTDANSHASFTSPQFSTALPAGDFVSATATDSSGDTSEFSADIPVGPTSGGPYSIVAGSSATFYAAAGPATSPSGYFWAINGQSYGSALNFTGYNPTLTWAQLQVLSITGPGQYSVQAEWVSSSNIVTPLPVTTLTIQTAPVTAAITTSLPSDDAGNPTATAGTATTLSSSVSDPNTANAVAGYAWSVVEQPESAALATTLVAATEYATRNMGESSDANASLVFNPPSSPSALGAPDGDAYGENGWIPDRSDSAPYLTLGFDTPMYANGVTIWENAGFSDRFFGFDYNGFVTRVDLLDTNGEYHPVWSGTDPTNSIAEAAFAVPFNQVSWTTSPYLVVGVRIYTTNYSGPPFPSALSNRTDVDAVQLSGSYDPTANGSVPLSGSSDAAVNRGRSDQYATSALAQATSSDQGGFAYETAEALGAPNATATNPNDPRAWSPFNQNGPPETLALGFAIPEYADGVTIREVQGNGFVTGVDVLPEGADPVTSWVNVWTGTDPTLPGATADFRVNWAETTYLVSAVRIDVNNNHDPNVYKEIDSVQLHGWFTQGTVVASGTGSRLTFTPNPADTNATYFATLTTTDSLGNVAMTQTTVDVASSVPPTARITNPTYSSGQVGFTLTATDPSRGDQAASFTIDWGDGSGVQTITATNGSATPTHAYSGAATYLVTVTATDTAGKSSAIATAVVFLSTAPADHILLGGGASPGQVSIGTAATSALMYSPTELVLVVGQDTADTYTVNFGHTFTTPITIAASGGALLANGADGDNYFDKVLGAPNQLLWAPVYGAASPVETVNFTGTSTTILVGGSGSNYFIDPGSGTTIDAGPAANTFVITATSGSGLTIDAGPSTNNYVIDLGSLVSPVTIQNSNPGASDSLTVNGGPANNTITFSGSQVTAGSQSISVNAQLTNVTINGGPGNNQITVGNLTGPVQNLAVNGGGGANTITLVNLAASVSSLAVSGGAGTTQIQVQGSLPIHVHGQHLPASQLAFTAAPAGTFAGFNLNSPSGVQVSVEDALGDVETGDNSTITLAIVSGPTGGGFLSGSVTAVAARGGTASFTKLAFNLSGTYTLKATDGSLIAATAIVVIAPNTGILLLDPTGQALTLSGNASLNVSNVGAIVVDSTNSAAASASGNASVTASEIDVAGGLTGAAAFHGAIVTGATPVADPLANLAAPARPSTQFTGGTYSGTLQPGTYVGGITVSPNSTATLQPGIYYLQGGGLTICGNSSLTGTGVMLYITGVTGTSVSISGNASVTLTPPTSGTYKGIVLFQDRASSAGITISGNGTLNTTGTEYAPAARVALVGNNTTDNPTHTSLGSEWIVADLSMSGNAKFAVTANANNRSENPNAFLVAGGPVSPSGSLPALTSGEVHATLQEAARLWGQAGLDPTTLQTLSQTTVVIAPLPAPYLGLAAPGVIYLDPTAEGYGWFVDASSSAVPLAGKIDLLTVLAHELGHEFGLMDGSGAPLMATTLAPGQRILPDVGDLSVPHITLTVPGLASSQSDPRGMQLVSANAAPGLPIAAAARSSATPEPRTRYSYADLVLIEPQDASYSRLLEETLSVYEEPIVAGSWTLVPCAAQDYASMTRSIDLVMADETNGKDSGWDSPVSGESLGFDW
jgi:hypothetical protein